MSERSFAKVAADRGGNVVALVERRGGRPAYDATVHLFDGASSELLASFEGPELSHLRVAVRGDRVVVGDYRTGMIVGFDLAGAVAWGPITVHPEALDSLTPSLDGERILAWITDAGRVRRVLTIDPRVGAFAEEQTAVFSSLPFNIGKMTSSACVSAGTFVVSGWAEDANAFVSPKMRAFDALFGAPTVPRAARLIGLTQMGGAMQLLWERNGRFVDIAPSRGGAVIGLVSNDGIDEAARDATPMLATSCVVQIDAKTGAETRRIDLGTTMAKTRDASLFAFGKRLVATDGSVRDTETGAVIARLG